MHPPQAAAARLNVRAGTGAPMAYRVWVVGLLARHDDAEPFLGGDEVVGVIGVLAEVDLHPGDSAGEDAAFAARPILPGRIVTVVGDAETRPRGRRSNKPGSSVGDHKAPLGRSVGRRPTSLPRPRYGTLWQRKCMTTDHAARQSRNRDRQSQPLAPYP